MLLYEYDGSLDVVAAFPSSYSNHLIILYIIFVLGRSRQSTIMQSILQYRKIRQTVQSEQRCKKQSASSGNILVQDSPSVNEYQTHADTQQQAHGFANWARTEDEIEKANDSNLLPYILVECNDLDDAFIPQNWSYGYKWMVTGIVSITSFIVTGASAIDSDIAPQLMQDFGVGEEVALLGTALFMIAFGLGSLISAPFSEILGRNPVYIASMLL